MLKHLLGIALGMLVLSSNVQAEERRIWKSVSVPSWSVGTTRPTDDEFLKILPPLNKENPTPSEQKEGYILWWGDYSLNIYSEQPPSKVDRQRKPVATTSVGEIEPLVLGIYGLRYLGEASLSGWRTTIPVKIRRVEFKPRLVPGMGAKDDSVKGARQVGLATYLLEETKGKVEAKTNTVFWIDITAPKKAGKYDITLDLYINDKHITLPIVLEVLDYELPRADIAYGMYFRPFEKARWQDRIAMKPEDITPEKLHMYWKDMADHGMTSATLYNIGGKFTSEDIASQETIAMALDMMKDGLLTKDVPVMYLDTSSINKDNASLVKEGARKLGLPEILYYGPDEPGVNEKANKEFEELQPIRKSLRIATAISDHAIMSYADKLDCWLIQGGQMIPEVQKLAKEKKAELWTYDCHHRGLGNTTWSRYYAGLYTWSFKLKGNFLWAYTEFFYREKGIDYPWTPTYCNVLPTDTGLIASLEWEARREGVEDYRTLHYLETLLLNHPNKKISGWLESIRNRTDWDLSRDIPPSMYAWDGPEMFPTCPNFKPEELTQIRKKAQEYIIKLIYKRVDSGNNILSDIGSH